MKQLCCSFLHFFNFLQFVLQHEVTRQLLRIQYHFLLMIYVSIVIGAVRHTAPIKIGYYQLTFSQTEKPTIQLKLI